MSNKTKAFALASLALVLAVPSIAATTNPRIDTSGVNVQPPYPASALLNHEAGDTLLSVDVDSSGGATSVHLVRSSGYGDLDTTAVNGVAKWRFVPAANEEGRAARGTVFVQIEFQPPPGASQAARANPDLPADFLSKPFDLEAEPGEQDSHSMSVPCANGSASVVARFSVATERYSHSHWWESGVPAIWVKATTKDGQWALLILSPLTRIAWTQDIRLELNDVQTISSDTFHAHPNFRDPVELKIAWSDYGMVTGTIGGESRELRLSSVPTKLYFGVFSAKANFSNTQLSCTPPS